MNKDLNFWEMKILVAAATETEREDEYFQMEEVKLGALTKNQVKGYLSQLVQKGYIETQQDNYFSGMFTEKAMELLSNVSL